MNSKPSKVYNLSEIYNVSTDSNSSAKRAKKALGSLPADGQAHPATSSTRCLRSRKEVAYAGADVEDNGKTKDPEYTVKDRLTYAQKAAGGVQKWQQSGGRRGAATAARDSKVSENQDAERSSRVAKMPKESYAPVSAEVFVKAPKASIQSVEASKRRAESGVRKAAENRKASKTTKRISKAPELSGRSGSPGHKGTVGAAKPPMPPKSLRAVAVKAPGVSEVSGAHGTPKASKMTRAQLLAAKLEADDAEVAELFRTLGVRGLRGSGGDATGASKTGRAQLLPAAPKAAKSTDVAGSSEAVGGGGAQGRRQEVIKVPTVPRTRAASKVLKASKSSKTSECSGVEKVPKPAETARTSRAPRAAKNIGREKKANTLEERDALDQDSDDSLLLFGSALNNTSDDEVDLAAEDRKAIEKKKKLREEFNLMTPRQQLLTCMYESDGENGSLSKAKKEKRKLNKTTQERRMLSIKLLENHVDLDKPMASIDFTFGTEQFTAASKRKKMPRNAVIPAPKEPVPEKVPTPPPRLSESSLREEPPLPGTPREQSEVQEAPIGDRRSPTPSPDLWKFPPLPQHLAEESDSETEEERSERRAEELVKIEKQLIWERVYKRNGVYAEKDEKKWLSLDDLTYVMREAPKLWLAIERDNQLDEYGYQRAPLDDIVEWPDVPSFANDFEYPAEVRRVVNWKYPGFISEL